MNEPTDGASFMSFGRSFQARTVEEKKELENKLVCTLVLITRTKTFFATRLKLENGFRVLVCT